MKRVFLWTSVLVLLTAISILTVGQLNQGIPPEPLEPLYWIDDWPMFHHDLVNSGFSMSSAPDTNDVLWKYGTGGYVFSSPVVKESRVYIGSNDDHIYCLNATNGNLIWKYQTNDNVYSSPAISKGKLYIGSNDNHIYCLNTANGNLIWKYRTDAPVAFSSPAIVNGITYMGSRDFGIYAFGS